MSYGIRLFDPIYLAVVAAHMGVGGFSSSRHFVPVLPFLFFYYALEAAHSLDGYAQRAFSATWPTMALRAVGALYVIWFVGLGVNSADSGVREAHSSPFGDYPIKRRSNYDAQRLALLLKEISRPDDRLRRRNVTWSTS